MSQRARLEDKSQMLTTHPPDMTGWTECGGVWLTPEEEIAALHEVRARHDRGLIVVSPEQRARFANTLRRG
jgi:hypothetical protein